MIQAPPMGLPAGIPPGMLDQQQYQARLMQAYLAQQGQQMNSGTSASIFNVERVFDPTAPNSAMPPSFEAMFAAQYQYMMLLAAQQACLGAGQPPTGPPTTAVTVLSQPVQSAKNDAKPSGTPTKRNADQADCYGERCGSG
jgi:hypothetical protein